MFYTFIKLKCYLLINFIIMNELLKVYHFDKKIRCGSNL